jgi:FHA domain
LNDSPEAREKIRAELAGQFAVNRENELIRLREELEAKIKLEMEESKPWEQRLADTRQRADARVDELKALGVLTGEEREAQLIKAKSIPHITNLHEDPLMDGQSLFLLEQGKVLKIGKRDASLHPDIVLAGLAILPEHAIIYQSNDKVGEVIVKPIDVNAKVYVNGDLISEPTILHHQSRLVFGISHAFKVVIPSMINDIKTESMVVDYAFAMMEIHKGQAKIFEEQEKKRRLEADEERKKADA